MSKNRAASIRACLKNRADAAKQDFNLTLTHYGLERLLYRLSVSSHAPNFLLKGALLFKLWYDCVQEAAEQEHAPLDRAREGWSALDLCVSVRLEGSGQHRWR